MITDVTLYLKYYLGCDVEVTYEDENGNMCLKSEGTLSWDHNENSEWILCDEIDESTGFEFKMKLRKLSSMTKEEARECWHLCGGSYGVTNPKMALIDRTFKAEFWQQQWATAFHYLISRGFWLWDETCFERGLILEKTENKENHGE